MAQPERFDLTGLDWGIYGGDTWGPLPCQVGRFVDDAAVSEGELILTSVDAVFGSGDVGATVIAYEFDENEDPVPLDDVLVTDCQIASVETAESVTLTNAALATLTPFSLAIYAQDISDYTFAAQIRSTAKHPVKLADFVITIVDEDAGSLELTLEPATTAALVVALKSGEAVWDFEMTDGNGVVTSWTRGQVAIASDVTR